MFPSSRKYDPGCSSRIPDLDFLPVPDPGIEKTPGPGSGTLEDYDKGGGALSLSGDEGGGSEGSHSEPNTDKHGLLPAYSLYGAELSRRVHISENISMWRVYILRDNLFNKKSRLIDRGEERSFAKLAFFKFNYPLKGLSHEIWLLVTCMVCSRPKEGTGPFLNF